MRLKIFPGFTALVLLCTLPTSAQEPGHILPVPGAPERDSTVAGNKGADTVAGNAGAESRMANEAADSIAVPKLSPQKWWIPQVGVYMSSFLGIFNGMGVQGKLDIYRGWVGVSVRAGGWFALPPGTGLPDSVEFRSFGWDFSARLDLGAIPIPVSTYPPYFSDGHAYLFGSAHLMSGNTVGLGAGIGYRFLEKEEKVASVELEVMFLENNPFDPRPQTRDKPFILPVLTLNGLFMGLFD